MSLSDKKKLILLGALLLAGIAEFFFWGNVYAGAFLEGGLGRCTREVLQENGDYYNAGRETCGTLRFGFKIDDRKWYGKAEIEHVSDVQENDLGHNSFNLLIGGEW